MFQKSDTKNFGLFRWAVLAIRVSFLDFLFSAFMLTDDETVIPLTAII